MASEKRPQTKRVRRVTKKFKGFFVSSASYTTVQLQVPEKAWPASWTL